jgi:peptidoglycan/xylan/chitin deacetylase (PgdA/CDA1 family)
VSPVALTFDDGPDVVWTGRLLDALGRHSARATFFVVAPRAQAQPEVVRRMQDEGHVVGLHCDEHVRHSDRDRGWVAADTSRALDRLAGLGVVPRLWRTPWGDTEPWSEQIAAEHGLAIVGWTADTHDWRGDSAAEMFEATAGQLRDGAIVLAHDGLGPGALRQDPRETIVYVELVAAHARRHDLKLSPLCA